MNKSLIPGALRATALAGLVAVMAVTAGCGDPSEAELLSTAKQQMAKRDNDAARLSVKTLLQQNPQSGEGRLLLGQLMLEASDMAGAEAELTKALELRQPEAAVVPLLAESMLAQGKGAALLQRFGSTSLASPKADASLKTQLANAQAQAGNVVGAENLISAALRAVPDHAPALLLRARLAAAGGDTAGGLSQVNALLANSPDQAEAWMLKGDLLQRAQPDDKPAAMAAYAEAVKRRPSFVSAHHALIMLQLTKPDVDAAKAQFAELQKVAPRHPQTMFLEAVLADQAQDYKKVREITQQLLRGAPNSPPLLMLAGQAELKLESLSQAEALFARAAQLVPKAVAPRMQLAQVQLRANQADKAIVTLRPLADANPPDAQALTLIAQAQLMAGDKQASEASFARAAKLQPTDARTRTSLALSQLASGNDKAGLAALQEIAASDKGSAADMALITARARRNDMAGALKAVDDMAAKMPGKALPDHVRGRLALQRDDAVGARRYFEASLAKERDYLPSLAGLAALDLAEKKPADARARFEASLQRNPKSLPAMLALAEITARSGGTQEETIKWLDEAVKAEPSNVTARGLLIDHYLSNRQPKQALNAAQAALAAVPDNLDLLDRQGRAQLLLGEAQQAVSTFNKMAQLSPKSPLPQLRLADAQSMAKNTGAMAAAVRRAAEIAPKDLLVLQAQVSLAMMENKPAQALSLARAVQASHPDEAVGFSLEGDVEMRQRNWDNAATALRKAAALKQPGDSVQRLHAALMAAKKTAEADKVAADHRKAEPGDLGFELYLGDASLAGGALPQAEAQYKKVLDKQPDNVIALNNLAYTLALQKKPGAVALAERAQKAAPDNPALMDTLAFCLAAENQLPRALELQTQVVAAAPDAPQFRLQLAKLQIQAGDKPAARTELNTLAKLGPAFNRQAEVAELLKSAGG